MSQSEVYIAEVSSSAHSILIFRVHDLSDYVDYFQFFITSNPCSFNNAEKYVDQNTHIIRVWVSAYGRVNISECAFKLRRYTHKHARVCVTSMYEPAYFFSSDDG